MNNTPKDKVLKIELEKEDINFLDINFNNDSVQPNSPYKNNKSNTPRTPQISSKPNCSPNAPRTPFSPIPWGIPNKYK
jgi:hypothetical protein